MNCPICKQAMKKVSRDISYNPKENNKEYDRTAYKCIADDAWITTEIPIVKKETSARELKK